MREESHLDDMRAAIRGDFERLEERRGEQDLMRIAEELEASEQPEPEPTRASVLEDAPAPEPEPRGEAAQPEPRSWLDRLLGR
ncbi:MAG: hypothetical protein ACRDQT_10655 [Gaiellaceae bacterium]